MDEQTKNMVRAHVANDTVDQAFKLVVTELRQHITWMATYVGVAEYQCTEGKDSLQQALATLHSINIFVIKELMLETLLPRLEDINRES